MNERKKVMIGAAALAALLVVVLASVALYRYLAPSSKQAAPDFGLGENEVALLVDGTLLDEKALMIEGEIYIPAATASQSVEQRVYVDTEEKKLCFASPDGLLEAKADEAAYMMAKETKQTKKPILLTQGDGLYVSLAFLTEHSTNDIQKYDNPPRLVIHKSRSKTYAMAKLNSAARLRTGPGKKYPWLTEVPEQQIEVIVETDIKQENEYMAVTTKDGITGYVPAGDVGEQVSKPWEFAKKPVSFAQKSTGKKVCLGWHQVTNEASSTSLYSGIDQAGPLNVISPTLFALSDNKGNFSSLASTAYVSEAHAKGLQVWGLINDFDKGIKLDTILSRTATRTKLVNGLAGAAIQYDLDGINIDFEHVKQESAAAFLEFLRELVLKCHANDIIVSVDAYTPADYNAYYDLEEQGRIVDYVILMAYDEHYAGSEKSGSVSSIGFVRSGVSNVLAKVPAERVVVALPFYTRLWHEVKTKKGVRVTSSAYGMSSAESLLRANGVTPKWDKKTGQYYARYKGNGGTYKIWMEEETSLKKKLEVVISKKTAGVAFWKLGFERTATWLTVEEAMKKLA